MDRLIGKLVNSRYRIQSVIGMGGMAIRTLQFGIIPIVRSLAKGGQSPDTEVCAKGNGE